MPSPCPFELSGYLWCLFWVWVLVICEPQLTRVGIVEVPQKTCSVNGHTFFLTTGKGWGRGISRVVPVFPLTPQESGPAEGEQAKAREAVHHQPEGEGASARTVATMTGAGQRGRRRRARSPSGENAVRRGCKEVEGRKLFK